MVDSMIYIRFQLHNQTDGKKSEYEKQKAEEEQHEEEQEETKEINEDEVYIKYIKAHKSRFLASREQRANRMKEIAALNGTTETCSNIFFFASWCVVSIFGLQQSIESEKKILLHTLVVAGGALNLTQFFITAKSLRITIVTTDCMNVLYTCTERERVFSCEYILHHSLG